MQRHYSTGTIESPALYLARRSETPVQCRLIGITKSKTFVYFHMVFFLGMFVSDRHRSSRCTLSRGENKYTYVEHLSLFGEHFHIKSAQMAHQATIAHMRESVCRRPMREEKLPLENETKVAATVRLHRLKKTYRQHAFRHLAPDIYARQQFRTASCASATAQPLI